MSATSRIKSPFGGGSSKYTNSGMVAAMMTYLAIKHQTTDSKTLKRLLLSIYVMQGSFNVGYAPSAGTHDKADCMDVTTEFDEALGKTIGILGWLRTRAQGFDPHVHLLRMYSAAMAWLATSQDRTYRANRANGLGNLSHYDSSWCPRYRGVKHISGPTTKHYVATVASNGYEQAGCTGKDADLIKKRRPKGFELYNIAGIVEAEGHRYAVTTTRTFYNMANFRLAPIKSVVDTVTTVYKTVVLGWSRHLTWNLGGMNPEGLDTWNGRVQDMVDRIAKHNPHFAHIQELPGAKRTDFDRRMKAIGYTRVSGSDGRYLYRKTKFTYVFRSRLLKPLAGWWNIDHRYKGDDKQAAWAKVRNWIISTPLLPVSGHLENEGPVDVKVEQFSSLCWLTTKKLDELKMPRGREVIAGDFNATASQLQHVATAYGLVDAITAKGSKAHKAMSSVPGLGEKAGRAGAPVDHIYVHQSRPILSAVIDTDADESDHAPLIVTIGRYAKVAA